MEEAVRDYLSLGLTRVPRLLWGGSFATSEWGVMGFIQLYLSPVSLVWSGIFDRILVLQAGMVPYPRPH